MTHTTRPVAALLVLYLLLGPLWPGGAAAGPTQRSAQRTGHRTAGEQPGPGAPVTSSTFVQLAERLGPAVVNLSTVKEVPQEDGGRRFAREQGTGFLISPDGYVLTNNHVVAGTDEVRVRLQDERERTGQVVGRDERTDIALVKVQAEPGDPALRTAVLGDSDGVRIGEWVVAIGNPFGLDHTVTAGIVSAKGRRDVRPGGNSGFFDFIQTDASINPGNSGGPLLNTRGEVVGINTAVNVIGSGIGFAIPINIAKVVVEQLKRSGHVARSWLGLYPQPVSENLRRAFGLRERGGALVAEVVPGSPAQEAGLQAGDVVVALSGKPVHDADDLMWLVGIAGERGVVLDVVRDGRQMQVRAELQEQEQQDPREERQRPVRDKPSALGMAVSELSRGMSEQVGFDEPGAGVYVVVVEPGSPAMEAGVERGDVIRQVNGKQVRTLVEYAQSMRGVPAGQMIRLLVRRPELARPQREGREGREGPEGQGEQGEQKDRAHQERRTWRNYWVAFSKR